MNIKVEQGEAASPADQLRYGISAILALVGLFGFYWFSDWPGALRGVLLAVAIIAAGVAFAFTARGRAVGEFLSESRFELRKVVWPTRQDTLRSTGLIIVVVILISILLAIIDFFLAGGIRWLLG